ncbi:MAG: M20 family metallopeptidase, partial [Bacilli bacterium]
MINNKDYDVIKIRRDLHQIPELSTKEYKTKEYIKNYLKNSKGKLIEINETGLILLYDYKKEKSIAFRCEEDALPIEEKNDFVYKSKHNGISHACGHDGHIAMILALSKYIDDNIFDYPKNIILVFQPSEEIRGGAKIVLDSLILQKNNVDEMYATHIWPQLEEGKIFTSKGALLASSSEVDVIIQGRSVHVGDYEKGNDALASACYFINAMYQKQKNILEEKYLLRCGKMESGVARNVISSSSILRITLRTYSSFMLRKLISLLEECKEEADKCFLTVTKIIVHNDYSMVYNNPSLVDKLQKLDISLLDNKYMQADDFGNYSSYFPCVMFLLGGG